MRWINASFFKSGVDLFDRLCFSGRRIDLGNRLSFGFELRTLFDALGNTDFCLSFTFCQLDSRFFFTLSFENICLLTTTRFMNSGTRFPFRQ